MTCRQHGSRHICCNSRITPPWNGNNWMCVCVCVCARSTWQTAAISDQTHTQLPCLLLPILRCSTKNSLNFGNPAVQFRIPNLSSWVEHDSRQGQGKYNLHCTGGGCSVGLHVGLTNHLCDKLHLQNVPQDFRLWRMLSCYTARRIWNTEVLRVSDLG
jgi:hypothetical protein